MPQSIWKGSISFGLVSIPIRLFSATEEKDISFRQVHREDGGRIRYKRVCSVDGEEVPYSDIAKGYELPDGEMVVLDDDDFANLPISSSRAVEVLSFVPAEQIDAVQMGKPYYCDPTGDAKPYVLLRDALENAERVAIVKVALRQRERLAVLRPREGVLVMQTLLWPDEVRAAKLDFLDEDVTVRSQELTMAESYISALSADFDPGEFSDHYREALEEVIEAKVAGREVVTPEEQPEASGQVVDLMEALRRSVAEAKSRRGETGGAGAAEPAASKSAKAPAKKTAAKTAGASAESTGKKAAKAPAKKAATKSAKTAKASKKPAKKTAARKSA
ncbi:MAG TPA: Ku protein [Actinomycetes bacterium]|nr:Ku protein [Actinomycetes bacterium]